MEAILKFNLPEEDDAYKTYQKAYDYYSAIFDIFNQLRQWRKYDGKESVTIEELDRAFFDILKDYGISL